MIKNRFEDGFVQGNFTWFIGKVESITDPENLNRVKVRCYGYHPFLDIGIPDTASVSTDDLPFATVVMPVTAASLKGIGGNHHLEIGSWVFGFFRDGPSAQDPMVVGSIATQEDGVQDIPTESSETNKVYKSKAGHLIEIDNTEGSERINVKHKSGTTINISSDGTVSIEASNDIVNIKGNTTITGTLHATGDISTDAGNAPTLAGHKHTEIPGTGGALSPSIPLVNTSIPDEPIT